MRIVTKINAALGVVLAVSVGLNLLILNMTIRPEFEGIERRAAEADYKRVVETLDDQFQKVLAPARDYGAWDDTFRFIGGELPEYESVNLNAEAFSALGVNLMMFADRGGNIKWVRNYDLESKAELALPEFARQALASDSPLLLPLVTNNASSAFVPTGNGLMMIAVAPVLKSDRTGPAAGVIVVGKLLDRAQIALQTKVQFSVDEPQAFANDELRSALFASLGSQPHARAMIADGRSILRATLLPDLAGNPLALLTVRSPRDITAAGGMVLDWALLAMAGVGALVLVFLSLLLNRIAIRRLKHLRDHLADVTATGALIELQGDGGSDELSTLQSGFNGMVRQVNELKDRLSEQSYRSGMAEVAVSALHNLRNCLVPVTTISGLLQESDEAPWVARVAKAASEYSSTDSTPERREKLKEYLAASAVRMSNERQERSEQLRRMAQATEEMQELLAEQNDLTLATRPSEALDILELVTAASTSALRDRGMSIAFDLPPSGPVVTGDRIMLRQVLSNLFANAGEAIQAADRGEGLIAVHFATGYDRHQLMLDISIEDNGDGIAPDRLETMFRRGNSTRRHKKGGLGLHWCANTIASMGGRIFAESPGPGQGATFHIVLPMEAERQRKAA